AGLGGRDPPGDRPRGRGRRGWRRVPGPPPPTAWGRACRQPEEYLGRTHPSLGARVREGERSPGTPMSPVAHPLLGPRAREIPLYLGAERASRALIAAGPPARCRR